LSWVVARFPKPDLLILSEGDLWLQLMKHAKKVALVSGKISLKSTERLKLFSFFSKRLLSHIDLFCVQSERFEERFLGLGVPASKIKVTGNLKLDIPVPALRATPFFSPSDPVIVLSSTHAPEEEWLLSALRAVWDAVPNLKVLLAPRHPERFSQVEKVLENSKIPFISLTRLALQTGEERVILVDTMGELMRCYQQARVAVLGGSFIPHVGGHNIFEPILCGIPVLFGPHMHAQKDLVDLVAPQAGSQVALSELPGVLLHLLQDEGAQSRLAGAACQLARGAQGASKRTMEALNTCL